MVKGFNRPPRFAGMLLMRLLVALTKCLDPSQEDLLKVIGAPGISGC